MAELQPDFDDSNWNKVNTGANADSLKKPEQAVYRAHLSINAEKLADKAVQLKIGRVDDSSRVYVNGRLAGESHDWASPATFEIKPFLHAGENTIAIAVINKDAAGGLDNNVVLKFLKKTGPLHWQRSVFNGYAQVLVQSTEIAGEIKLTATADDLKQAGITIHTR